MITEIFSIMAKKFAIIFWKTQIDVDLAYEKRQGWRLSWAMNGDNLLKFDPLQTIRITHYGIRLWLFTDKDDRHQSTRQP